MVVDSISTFNLPFHCSWVKLGSPQHHLQTGVRNSFRFRVNKLNQLSQMYSFTSKYLKYNSCSFCSRFLTKSLWTLGLVYGVSIYLMMVKHTSNGTNSWLQQNKTSSVRQKDECATSRSYLNSKLLHFTGNITRSGIFCFACCGFNPTLWMGSDVRFVSASQKKDFPQNLPTQTLHFMDTWRKMWLHLRLRSCRFSERVMSLETNRRLFEQCPVCVGAAEKLPLNVKYKRFSCADMTDFIHSAWNKTSLCVEGVGVSAYPEISLVNIEGPAEKPAAGLWCRPRAKSLKSQGSSPTEVRVQSSVDF